ncbi:hypothetical protein F0562_002864 [Nyssa sinensis]|uniref:Uncharacterized protein n=1 Tax=Nyssa sinensis TaxID=561372 RepID=A0A5J5BXE6_9ASTE|nr:hypothetical protein F0562_002864 [Nyssa sinensis]
MDHHIEIEEEILPGSSRLSRADTKIVDGINAKIHSLPALHPKPCIFRVHDGLHRTNEKAYAPTLVSIGPYHHGKPKLQAMEEHKLWYLRSILQRNSEKSVERYIQVMEKLEDRARGFYAEPINLEREKFVEMMLLDACFIIEFLRKLYSDKDDPIIKSFWMGNQIFRDMMLLENQLPLFVLCKLFDMITKIPSSPSSMSLTKLVQTPIGIMLSKTFSSIPTIQLEEKSIRESKHFLDLLHKVCLSLSPKASFNIPPVSIRMPCLTELQEAGVSFKVVETSTRSDSLSFFDITFECGQLKIPKFMVKDLTVIFFRNIIAYEQHSSDVKIRYFTDYTFFMDKLINTGKDVNILRLRGIMENWLGDDGEVARMFNKMGDGRIIDVETYYYSEHISQYFKQRSFRAAFEHLTAHFES